MTKATIDPSGPDQQQGTAKNVRLTTLHRLIRPRESVADLSRYSIFVNLYVTSFLLEMVEYWTYPEVTIAAILVSVVSILQTNRFSFLCFLTGTTSYFLLYRFPDVANHVNLIIFCNLTLIVALLYSFAKPAIFPNDHVFFEAIQPVLRLLIILTFCIAGFHKLNYDFLNPAVSCVSIFSARVVEAMSLPLAGVPVAIIALVIALTAVVLLRRQVPDPAMPQLDVGAILPPALAMILVVVAFLSVIGRSQITSASSLLLFLVAVGILCWQLIEGPLLLISRFQWFALCLCLLVHMTLAMVGFVDFQALAIALLMTFVPADVLEAWRRRRTIGIWSIQVHRVHAYFLLNLGAGLGNGINYHFLEVGPAKVLPGLVFNISLLILLWPIILDIFFRNRSWRWKGVGVLNTKCPKFFYVMPMMLLLFGLTSYFGLRTAGNFSMFSNLRTEMGQSNHLLLKKNPLMFADYESDVVRVHDINDEQAQIGQQYHELKGMALPVVEFKKLIFLWREAGRRVPIEFEYNGTIYAFADITKEPAWAVDGFDWEMKLLDFRVIQPEGPNRCRW